MTEESFKFPGSSYAELVKIIRAYGHAPDDAVPKDVADRAGMDPTQVSRNNGFLLSIGILSGGKRKTLTSEGKSLAQALDFDMPDQIEKAWSTIVVGNEFLKKIISAIRIRGGMDPYALRNHVAYTAGLPKNPRSMTGAGTIIDVLKAAALIREEDGKIIAIVESEPITEIHAATQRPISVLSESKQKVKIPLTQVSPSASLVIQIRVDCRPEELESLGPKLRMLIEALGKEHAQE